MKPNDLLYLSGLSEIHTVREAWKYIIIALVVVGIFSVGRSLNHWKDTDYRISSGKPGGGYEAFALGLTQLCEEKEAISMAHQDSEGSVANLEKVISGEVDFGLFQLSIPLHEDAAVVATIYEDVVHILVRSDSGISSFLELDGKKMYYGLDGSGTKIIAEKLLSHYGITGVQRVTSTPSESLNALREGEIDAVIVVTAMHAPQIVEAVCSGKVKHLSLGDPAEQYNATHGICQANASLKPSVIPPHTYGRANSGNVALPEQTVGTISVPSVLICHKDAHPDLVQLLTQTIFKNRHFLTNYNVDAMNLKEPENIQLHQYHEGAIRFYRREDPVFFVKYAETIALVLSILIAFLGACSAINKWVNVRNKNRIDLYYVKVGNSIKNLHDHAVDDLEAEEEKLYALRQQAFTELVDEKLSPDESFRIFQDLLEQAFEECHRQMDLNEKKET